MQQGQEEGHGMEADERVPGKGRHTGLTCFPQCSSAWSTTYAPA